MSEQQPTENADVKSALPKHVAIIMDGNGRWAEQRGKMRVAGHNEGAKAVRRAVTFAAELGLGSLTLYAFSSENWRRPEQEVSALMKLFMASLKREAKRMDKNNIRLRIIGDKSAFSEALQSKIADVEAMTANNSGLQLNICASYGGRWDITQACQALAQKVRAGEINPDDITEESLGEEVCLNGQPELDLMIRTGGDHRISNFLLWQVAYAELFFSDGLWPDFDEHAFSEALASYASRERRFGCTGAQIRELVRQHTAGDIIMEDVEK